MLPSPQTRSQYLAIAWLRWRIFVNQFRRKGGGGELAAQIIVYPIAAMIALGPTFGAGVVSWYFASSGRLDRISLVLWAAFALCQFLNIQLGQPGTTFDPTQLIRFPLTVADYIAVRLFFGLLAPANIVGTLIAFAIATGITIALPDLWFYAYASLAVFAVTNVLFSRMVFAWVDRWLSTRRAREVFTGLIFVVSIGIQWVNFTYNPAYNHHHGHNGADSAVLHQRIDTTTTLYHRLQPWLAVFPPGLTGSAITAASLGHTLAYLANTLACALFAALFLAIFAYRTRTEYRGENLSDQANAVAKSPTKLPAQAALPGHDTPATTGVPFRNFGLSPAVAAVLGKELLTIRRNTGVFYGIIAPIFIVFLFVLKTASGNTAPWIFPAALAYAMAGIAALPYNSFGMEDAGSQFYFMAPIQIRQVFLAKNIVSFVLALLEVAMVFAIITYVSAVPSLRMTVAALLWVTATLLFSMVLGNRRSITAPKKIESGRTAAKQASPLSALMSFGVLIASATFGAALLLAEDYFDLHWLLLPTLTVCALAALGLYLHSLRNIDRFTLAHRDQLFAELCKK